ncbi:MAG: penicillin acylase family protein [Bacteroidota bacterium]
MRYAFVVLLLSTQLVGQNFTPQEISRWEARAAGVEIIRDNWGIPHIYAPTDADAVFGMLYAQCEDDFPRVEENYLISTGQRALADGEDYIYHDLRARLWMDSTDAIQLYNTAPDWLRALCDGFADGINYYLHTHPKVKPKWITRFEPWMPFTFSEGSIGGDITRVSTEGLAAFYGDGTIGYQAPAQDEFLKDDLLAPMGSNGFAVSRRLATEGKGLLLINPHVSFFFRTEQHVVSEEGLDVYGAATWGQFFIYQGFNEYCGWMHTSTWADAIDQYLEEVTKGEDGKYFYRYGEEQRPVETEEVIIPYSDGDNIKERAFTIYRTHHGPIIGEEEGKWVAFRMMDRPTDALTQDFQRTKAKGYGSFRKSMKIRTNSSNNTVFADRKGNIAYWHGNYIPKRNPNYDYSGYVDGSDPAQDWDGIHKLGEMIELKNPKNGWLQNCNSTPFTAAADGYNVEAADYEPYQAPDWENFRGINARRVLASMPTYNLDSLIKAANSPQLAAFENLIPDLKAAFDEVGGNGRLNAAVRLLVNWDRNYGISSIPTSVAILWAERALSRAYEITPEEVRNEELFDQWIIKYISAEEKLQMLEETLNELEQNFSSWQTPWGVINRYQRLDGAIEPHFNDERPSLPVGFASARWGSIAAFAGWADNGSKKRYGRHGNSFVAAISFGKRLTAKAIVTGGQSGDPKSPHFSDQAKAFCNREFREVYFYREDVEAAAERRYQPGK